MFEEVILDLVIFGPNIYQQDLQVQCDVREKHVHKHLTAESISQSVGVNVNVNKITGNMNS